MATLLSDIVDYIVEELGLVVDTDLFLAVEPSSSMGKAAVVREVPGSFENESGLIVQSFQIDCKDLDYNISEALANSIYVLFNHKPGFSGEGIGNRSIKYCEPTSRPVPIIRDELGRFIFIVPFLLRM